MNDKEKKDMKSSAKEGGGNANSQLEKANSKEEKKNKNDHREIIDTSSRPHDPKTELHNFSNPSSKFLT
jgi:hypothetical protein